MMDFLSIKCYNKINSVQFEILEDLYMTWSEKIKELRNKLFITQA